MNLFTIILLCAVGGLGVIDLKRKSISLIAPVALLIFCVLYNLIMKQLSVEGMLLGTIPAGIMLLMVKIGRLKVGMGDILLIAVLGVGIGVESVCMTLLIASCLCAAVSILLLLFRRIKRDSTVAFIPFIGAGLALSSIVQMSL